MCVFDQRPFRFLTHIPAFVSFVCGIIWKRKENEVKLLHAHSEIQEKFQDLFTNISAETTTVCICYQCWIGVQCIVCSDMWEYVEILCMCGVTKRRFFFLLNFASKPKSTKQTLVCDFIYRWDAFKPAQLIRISFTLWNERVLWRFVILMPTVMSLYSNNWKQCPSVFKIYCVLIAWRKGLEFEKEKENHMNWPLGGFSDKN